MSQRITRTVLLLAAACAALLVFATAGMARSQADRNHDRIPDRWERAHHLSLKVNQARRDQDHDGLRNRAEFLAGTDPRKADTDGDGHDDGAEGAGTVTSFTGGVLTIHLFTGDDLKGTVDDQTEIQCRTRPSGITMRAASDGPGGNDQGDDNGGRGSGESGDDHGDNNDQGDDQGAQNGCDASALTAGAVVHEAQLEASSGGLVFSEIKLVS